MKIYEYYGKLFFNEDGEYILEKTNISQILDEIYHSNISNVCDVVINIGKKIIFSEEGILTLYPIAKRFYSLHVDGVDLETVLFNNVGKMIKFTISAPILERNNYVSENEYRQKQA